jgi:predicted MPP superfamily phosphohydrolase
MIIAITIMFALLGVYLDFKAYSRISKAKISKFIKYAYLSVVAVSYLLISSTPLVMYHFINENNSTFMMKFSMALLTVFLALSVPRMLFNVMLLLSKKRFWMLTSVVLSLFVFIFFLYSIFVTRTDYNIKEVQLYYDNLPDGFDGYRLAFISDIHIGTMLNASDELEGLFEMIDETGVSAVFFGGDLVNVHHSEVDEDILGVFSRLKPRDGVFMVLGNHDTGAYMKNSSEAKRSDSMASLEQKMQRTGWVVLRDSTVYIHKGGDSIAVTGIDYSEQLLKFRHSMDAVDSVEFGHIYNNVDCSLFNITISHLPQLWRSICGYSDLTLSGHIHAMQMKIGSFSPAKFMYKEWSGLYESDNGKLYINDGIGCVGYLARFGARPEITVIELHRK